MFHAANAGIQQLVRMDVQQAYRAHLGPGQRLVLGGTAAQRRAVVGRVWRRPDHAVDGQHAQRRRRAGTAPGLRDQAKQLPQRIAA